uniref:Uncharacterized protein n=1 Tax=Equus asinus TaxID=9793 RepID=A0A9L0K961_EQUAS
MAAHILLLWLLASSVLGDPDSAGRRPGPQAPQPRGRPCSLGTCQAHRALGEGRPRAPGPPQLRAPAAARGQRPAAAPGPQPATTKPAQGPARRVTSARLCSSPRLSLPICRLGPRPQVSLPLTLPPGLTDHLSLPPPPGCDQRPAGALYGQRLFTFQRPE